MILYQLLILLSYANLLISAVGLVFLFINQSRRKQGVWMIILGVIIIYLLKYFQDTNLLENFTSSFPSILLY